MSKSTPKVQHNSLCDYRNVPLMWLKKCDKFGLKSRFNDFRIETTRWKLCTNKKHWNHKKLNSELQNKFYCDKESMILSSWPISERFLPKMSRFLSTVQNKIVTSRATLCMNNKEIVQKSNNLVSMFQGWLTYLKCQTFS